MDSASESANMVVRAEEAVRLVTEGEALQPADPPGAAGLFRRAAEITGASGDVSMSAGAYEREIQAWAAAGDSRRARQAADQALAAIGGVEDLDMRVVLTTNVATALGSAGFDDDAIELLTSAHAALMTGPSPDPDTEAAIFLNIAVSETKLRRADKALDRLAAAAAIAERAANTRMLATIRFNEAVAFSALHEARRSRAAYNAALRLYRAAGANGRGRSPSPGSRRAGVISRTIEVLGASSPVQGYGQLPGRVARASAIAVAALLAMPILLASVRCLQKAAGTPFPSPRSRCQVRNSASGKERWLRGGTR